MTGIVISTESLFLVGGPCTWPVCTNQARYQVTVKNVLKEMCRCCGSGEVAHVLFGGLLCDTHTNEINNDPRVFYDQ